MAKLAGNHWGLPGLALLLLFCSTSAAALSLTIGIPQTPDSTVQSRLASTLEQALAKQDHLVQIIAQHDSYLHNIRGGYFDAFFAEPHIGAWAIDKRGYIAVARLSASLNYHLIAQRNQADIFELRDLARRDVCSPKMPFLGRQFLERLFTDTENKPTVLEVNPQRQIIDIIEQPCVAFVVDEQRYLANNLDQSHITLAQSPRFSHIGFFAHPRLSMELKDQLLQALLAPGNQPTWQLLTDYYAEKTPWVASDNTDFPINWQHWLPQHWLTQ